MGLIAKAPPLSDRSNAFGVVIGVEQVGAAAFEPLCLQKFQKALAALGEQLVEIAGGHALIARDISGMQIDLGQSPVDGERNPAKMRRLDGAEVSLRRLYRAQDSA